MTNTIHPDTHMGKVTLTVSDLARSLDFYENQIGLTTLVQADGQATVGTPEHELLVLQERKGATRYPRTSGLYHYALLLPSRLQLALTLKHLIATQTPFTGFADHGVSEALYLPDPDGHGIEIYRDRPRDEWYIQGRFNLITDPLNLEDVLSELEKSDEQWSGIHPDTVMGHVHLHVAQLPASKHFYVDVLGFGTMLEMSSAHFISAGGYHHHLGYNIWAGRGAPPPPEDSLRLVQYEICLPSATALTEVISRIEKAGIQLEQQDKGWLVRDPSQNLIHLLAPTS